MTARDMINLACMIILAAGIAYAGIAYAKERDRSAALERAATDYALQLAEAEGVGARVAEERDQLLESLSDTSRAFGRVLARLDSIGARNARLTTLLSRARATVDEDTGTVHVAAPDGGAAERPCEACLLPGDSVTGSWASGPFRSRWTFHALDRLSQDVRAEIRAEMVQVDLPDGRVAVFPRAVTPGVELEVERLEWDPPEPEPGISVAGVGVSGGVGLLAGLGACLLTR
jgi:hypothetical protein